jgi:adenosyl cobinamide kinase/adenosyl cobinamide phosphate guanylyltransferase
VDTVGDRSVRGRVILITGGARSGKSTHAERLAAQLAEPLGGRVTYIATSQSYDDEMAQRVSAHQTSRPETWTTVECPLEVAAAVRAAAARTNGHGAGAAGSAGAPPVVLLDCVTLWVTNLLFSGGAFGGSAPPEEGYNYDKDLLPPAEERAAAARVTAALDGLVAAVAETGVTLVAVTNEVGLGVVPEYPLARLYRDQLGWANQRLARDAEDFYLLISGYPLDVKALAALGAARTADDPSSPMKEPQ